jgi:hypothetical protein
MAFQLVCYCTIEKNEGMSMRVVCGVQNMMKMMRGEAVVA